MDNKLIITREQLRSLRDTSMEFSKSKNANQNWKKHLIDLSNQCDILDAVMARAGISAMELEGKKIKKVAEAVDNKEVENEG